jgi:hypothetical protein
VAAVPDTVFPFEGIRTLVVSAVEVWIAEGPPTKKELVAVLPSRVLDPA